MMIPLIVLPEAGDDIDAAYHDYEAKRTGLGEEFLGELRSKLADLRVPPEMYGFVEEGVRAAPVRRLPFVAYYRAVPAGVVVIAVRHGRDDPAIWQSRI